MKYFLPFVLLCGVILLSCNKNVTVKVIEEHDPIVKTIEEKDSMVIFPRDSATFKQRK